MNFARKTFAILMAGALTAGLMAGCDKLPGDSSSGASSAASSSAASTDSFDYSAPFDENGLWKDVTALDYVTLATYKGVEVPSSVYTIADDAVDTQVNSILSGYSTTNQVLDRAVVFRLFTIVGIWHIAPFLRQRHRGGRGERDAFISRTKKRVKCKTLPHALDQHIRIAVGQLR